MRRWLLRLILISGCLAVLGTATRAAHALPVGYTKTTIPLNAAPSGLAYDSTGTLYAFETPANGTNTATVRVFQPDLTESASFTVTGLDASSFYLGGMTYDPIDNALLFTDNAPGNVSQEALALYSYDLDTGMQSTVATGIASIAGVAVRSSGEIFVSTAPFSDNAGEVLMVDRGTGTPTTVMTGLDFGAGLAFDAAGDLIVQDANFSSPYLGRLQKLPISGTGTLSFGTAVPMLDGLQASAGVVVDSEGDIFISGSGGLFEAKGSPLVASSFDTNGNQYQFSTALAFFPGTEPFEPYATGDARLAFMSDFGFGQKDQFITLITTGASSASLPGIPEPGTGVCLLLGSLLLVRLRKKRLG